MNWHYTLYSFIRNVTPPIITNCINRISQAIRQNSFYTQKIEKKSDFYDQSFSNKIWQTHYSESPYYFLWAVIADRINRDNVEAVLDIGCGTGQLALLLKDKGIKKYCGIDFSKKRIERARKKCPGFKFILGNVFHTSIFDDIKYDAIVCTEFLEHVKNDIEIIERFPSGIKFYGSVPNFPSKAHIRHFKNITAVYDRYKKYFNDFKIDKFLMNKLNKVFYIVDGIKK